MAYLIVCVSAFIIALFALFSGFGVGTVLMPVFAIFFPLPIAIASTAVIHWANNVFKAILMGKFAKWSVVIKFGLPAAITSAWGAYLLGYFAKLPYLAHYFVLGYEFHVTLIGLIVGIIIMVSSLLELIPKFSQISFPANTVVFGGLLSGFFGGISGNQGVLRSAFLIKSGLNQVEFIGTGIMCSIIVDTVRIIVYGWAIYGAHFDHAQSSTMNGILIAATLSAFAGSYIGSKLVRDVTLSAMQFIIGIMLFVLGFAISVGVVHA